MGLDRDGRVVAGGRRVSGLRPLTQTYFVQLLRNPRIWPLLHTIPEPRREEVLAIFPWRMEYECMTLGWPTPFPRDCGCPGCTTRT